MRSEKVGEVESIDGAPIGFRTVGAGPALIFVHGSVDTGESWVPVAEALSETFTCYLVDRRGRGLSGDAEVYSLDLEVADIRAVSEAVDPTAALVGHSYGAICVLRALLDGVDARAAVLYDPPLPVYGPVAGEGLPKFSSLVAAGDLDNALAYAFTEFAHAPAEVVAGLRRSPRWPHLVALTPSWERELRAIDALGPGVEPYARVGVPTLCLVGELANPYVVDRTRALAGVLPDARTVVLPGQGEGPPAHQSAPELFVDAVRDFSPIH